MQRRALQRGGRREAKLKKEASRIEDVRLNIEALTFDLPDGGVRKPLYLLAEGKLVNLAAGDGHPAEIMDISFALQALSMEYLVQNKGRLENAVHPRARRNRQSRGVAQTANARAFHRYADGRTGGLYQLRERVRTRRKPE